MHQLRFPTEREPILPAHLPITIVVHPVALFRRARVRRRLLIVAVVAAAAGANGVQMAVAVGVQPLGLAAGATAASHARDGAVRRIGVLAGQAGVALAVA